MKSQPSLAPSPLKFCISFEIKETNRKNKKNDKKKEKEKRGYVEVK